MPVDGERARRLALSLPGVSEAPHFQRVAFRTPRKTFATLDAIAGDLNLMFSPTLRDVFCEQAPHVFTPVPGGWGRMGITRCDLQAAEAEVRKNFFFEKKNQKTFATWRHAKRSTSSVAPKDKSLFASFYSEKEDSSYPCFQAASARGASTSFCAAG